MKKAPRFLAGTLLIAGGLTLAGCSTGNATRSRQGPDPVQVTSFWQPYLLYVLAAPHPRLYVEIDAVQGCAPNEAALGKFRDFLTAYCHKPGGIEIVRSDVIPIAAARGIPPAPLARKYLNGPPDEPDAPAPAFMYVLYYSGALCDKPPAVETRAVRAEATSHRRQKDAHCYADLLPYPAIIFMNTNYMRNWHRNQVLPHEAGHLLGLAGRPTHARGYHCRDGTCLMNEYFSFRRFLFGWQRRLCQRCVAQWADSVQQPPPSNLRFAGPVLVRSQDGYCVLSLPKRLRIVVGDLTAQNCRDFAADVHKETPAPGSNNGEFRIDAHIDQEVLDDPAQLRDIVNWARNDPYEPVRDIAAKVWSEIVERPL